MNVLCLLVQMLERETSREKNLEKAQKEAKIRARKEAGKSMYTAALVKPEEDDAILQVPPCWLSNNP